MAEEVSSADFREVMSHLASGVSVVATRDLVGRDCALTVTSLVSLSLQPPLCLVAVKRDGFLHDALEVADGWAFTMLATDQVELARYTARHRYPGDTDDFSPFLHRRATATGALYFPQGVAALECRPEAIVPRGDHTIAVGRVVGQPPDCTGTDPLLYLQRHYRRIGDTLGHG